MPRSHRHRLRQCPAPHAGAPPPLPACLPACLRFRTDLPSNQATRPISLQVIEHNVHAHAYSSPAAFETHILQLFADARLARKMGTQAYSQVVRLQHIYLELVNWPCADSIETIEAHMDAVVHQASLQPTPFSTVPVGPGDASTNPSHRGMDMPPPSTSEAVAQARLHNREKVVLEHAAFKGQIYHVGDWVHLINPSDPAKPIVGQIFKILQKVSPSNHSGARATTPTPDSSSSVPLPTPTGQYYVSVCWYHRPEETVHSASRRFIDREVFKTGIMVDHKIQDIVERCFVMFYTRFIRGRPTSAVWNAATETLYVSEFRYNDLTRQFTKIKSWNSCIPEELRGGEVPMDSFSKTVLPERKLSPFVLGTADGPGFLIPEGLGQPPSMDKSIPLSRKRPAAGPEMDMRPRKEATMRSRRPPPPPPLLPGFPHAGNFLLSPNSFPHPTAMMPPSQHASLAVPNTPGLSPSPPMAEVSYRPSSAGGHLGMGVNFGIPQIFSPDMFFSHGGEIRSQTVPEPVSPAPMAINSTSNTNTNNWLAAPMQRVRHSSVPIDTDRGGFLSPLVLPHVSTPDPSVATAPVSPLLMDSPVRFLAASTPGPGRDTGPAPAFAMTPPSNWETPIVPMQRRSQHEQLIPELVFDSVGSTLGDVSTASSTWPAPGTPAPPIVAVQAELSPALGASPFWTEAPDRMQAQAQVQSQTQIQAQTQDQAQTQTQALAHTQARAQARAQEAKAAPVLRRPSFGISHSLASFSDRGLDAEHTPPSSEDGTVCARAHEAPSAGVLSPLDKLFPLPPDAALERLFPLEELGD